MVIVRPARKRAVEKDDYIAAYEERMVIERPAKKRSIEKDGYSATCEEARYRKGLGEIHFAVA